MASVIPTQPNPSLPFPSPDQVYRFTVDQFDGMVRNGTPDEDEPVELLNGLLVTKMPKNPRHRVATRKAVRALEGVLPAEDKGPGVFFGLFLLGFVQKLSLRGSRKRLSSPYPPPSPYPPAVKVCRKIRAVYELSGFCDSSTAFMSSTPHHRATLLGPLWIHGIVSMPPADHSAPPSARGSISAQARTRASQAIVSPVSSSTSQRVTSCAVIGSHRLRPVSM